MSALRAGVRVALNRPRVLALAAVVVAGEVGLRLAAGLVHPVLFVLAPPVVAVSLAGAAAPALRAAALAPGDDPAWRLRTRLRTAGPRLLGVAVGGHALALGAGTALFLLVDTPVRYALYALGTGSLPATAVFSAPLAGVAAGTLLAWGVLAPAAARAGDGAAPARALRAAAGIAVAGPRGTAAVLGAHALAALGLGVAVLTAAVYAGRAANVGALLLAGCGVGGLVATLALTFLLPVHAALDAAAPGADPPALPWRRLALAAVVVAGLVAGATAVRVTETRPAPSPDPLPPDPSAGYAAAVANTAATAHAVTLRWSDREDDSVTVTRALDRRDRQYRTAWRAGDDATLGYADSGVSYGVTTGGTGPDSPLSLGTRTVDGEAATALPGYWAVAPDYELAGDFGLPRPGTGEWTVRTDGDARTYELAGGDAAFAAIYGRPPPAGATYDAARIRVRVDADRDVVAGGSARLNATLGDGGERVVVAVDYEVRTGAAADVRRPAALDPRTPGEWLWTVFAY